MFQTYTFPEFKMYKIKALLYALKSFYFCKRHGLQMRQQLSTWVSLY